MKWILTISRYLFISPEFFLILLGIVGYIFWPDWFAAISERISRQVGILKYIGLLPAGLIVFDCRTIKDILLPAADKKTILQNWELYWSLKCGCIVGFFYGIIFAIIGIVALLFDWQHPAAYQSAFLITTVAGALTAAGTLYYAHICVEEHFRRHAVK